MPPKKSTVDMTKNAIGDIVLGQLKGFPKWPCKIVNPEETNDHVRSEMPGKGKSSHLLCFFPKGDFAWVSPKDIYPLPEKDIRAFLSKGGKSNGELRRGYEVALDPTAWIAQKAEEDTQRAMQYEENLARIEAGEAEEEYDYELESVAKKAGGGKRKRASEASPKMRVNAQDSRNKKASNASTSKSKSRGMAEDEDEGPSKKKSKAADDNDPPGLKQLKEWRHKLQRAFLGESGINPQEMAKCAEYFDAMEAFDCNREFFVESKLGKVFKRLATLNIIPHDSEYRFRERTVALVTKWAKVEESNGLNGVGPAPVAAAPVVDAAAVVAIPDVEMAVAAPIVEAPTPLVEAPVIEESAPAVIVPAPVAIAEPIVEVAPVAIEAAIAPVVNGTASLTSAIAAEAPTPVAP